MVVLTENVKIASLYHCRVDAHSCLLTFGARTERAKPGINGNLWSRGTATMSYPCHACEETQPCSVDVLPGRASAIQATRGDGMGRLGGASSEHSGRVHSTAEERVPHRRARVNRKTRQQRWSRLLELFHFSGHVFQRLWSEHDVFQCAMCDGANTVPKWQRHGGFRIAS